MAVIGGEEGHQLTQFSDLPDVILIRILSMLPTKSAVQTCLLVLRRSGQHHLWKYLPSLEFDQDKFTRKNDFKNFVDRVMDLCDNSVPLVSLSIDNCLAEAQHEHRIRTWLTKAVQCNVEKLTLSILLDFRMANTPYCCIFGCKSLVKLDLKWITFNVSASVICLPRLKYLRLSRVKLKGDDESTEKLLSSPLLEELILDECSYRDNQSIHVCSPKLQVLKISDFLYRYGNGSKICIIGDNLKYFSYMGGLVNEYRICASSCTQLSKVDIDVNKEMPGEYALNCYNILKGLSGTRNLTLSDYFLEGLQNSLELLDTIPIFEALTQLKIQVFNEAIRLDSLALLKMYERCPHLDCLSIIGKGSLAVRGSQLSPIPLCFHTNLKEILVHNYVPGDEDDAAIDVLLNSALVLEELVIYCKRDKEKGFHEGGHKIQELQDRLNRRPKVSKDCIISVRVHV